MKLRKNMKLGNKIYLILISCFFSLNLLIAEEKISTSPLINIEKIKPSFEELVEDSEATFSQQDLKKKKIKN